MVQRHTVRRVQRWPLSPTINGVRNLGRPSHSVAAAAAAACHLTNPQTWRFLFARRRWFTYVAVCTQKISCCTQVYWIRVIECSWLWTCKTCMNSSDMATQTPSVLQALRSLRSRKQVEKRADNLFNQLESIRGILDRIAQSQTDKMVRGGASIHLCLQVLDWVSSVCWWTCLQVIQAYQAGVAALKLSLKDVTVERAESLVDQIQEVGAPFRLVINHHGGWNCTVKSSFLKLLSDFPQLCDTQDDVNQTISSVTSGGMLSANAKVYCFEDLTVYGEV